MNDTEIKVSIICNVYNHEKYIRDALEGFVMQKTNFAFEVLIHDDASTDKTANIIREYELKYPEIIKPIYQTENQYSKGHGIAQFQEPRIKGKYVAFCEGDDYWTDPLKLQKQYDAMEAHPEVDMCAHGAISVEANTKRELLCICPSVNDEVLSTEKVIDGGGGYVATASLFYRAELLCNLPKFRQFLRLDYTLQIHGSLRGGILYLADCMCVYRVMADGSWTARMSKDKEKRDKHFSKVQKMLCILNEETDKKYDAVIQKKLLKNEFLHLLSNGEYKKVIASKYKIFFNEMTASERFKTRLKVIFPILINIKRKLVK